MQQKKIFDIQLKKYPQATECSPGRGLVDFFSHLCSLSGENPVEKTSEPKKIWNRATTKHLSKDNFQPH